MREKMGVTRLSSKGQITIPKEVREKLNLKPGDRVVVEAAEGERAILRPLGKPSTTMRGIGRRTREALGNPRAVELVRVMRGEDGEEL
jgi:AbrB family looped-hinge helix DNA binding protein